MVDERRDEHGQQPAAGGGEQRVRAEGSGVSTAANPETERGDDGIAIPEVLSIIATGASVLYPAIVVPYVSADEPDIRAVDEATSLPNRIVGVFAQQPTSEGVYDGPLQPIGTAATILRMARAPQGGVQAILQGVTRVRLVEIVQQQPSWRARVERLVEHVEPSTELEALTRNVLALFQRIVALSESIPNELALAVSSITSPGNLADFIAANLPFRPEDRLAVLATLDVTERMRVVNGFLTREVEVAEVGQKIRTQVQGDMDKRQREFILREQLAAIQKELGEEERPELADLRRKLDEAQLPEQARREADRELQRLAAINQASPEYQVARTYLEWLSDLPWAKSTPEHLDIVEAERVLNADHYGLDRVKQRILDYLAVRKLRQDTRGPILCFVGPPGVGKTSLGQSIARATGRTFIRMSLGGVRDEAEIRGHRRTYVGAMPGRIIQDLRRAGSNNPLIMLDEVDKLGADYRGDPAAALLEVLDPAQNNSFVDHYLDVPFDLSRVLFITTANQLDPIPGPLRDRMEIIDIAGYTEREKLEIAKRYLLPRQQRENGLQPGQVEMSDETLLALIRGYTREAGVRNLERAIGAVCRRLARRVAQAETGSDQRPPATEGGATVTTTTTVAAAQRDTNEPGQEGLTAPEGEITEPEEPVVPSPPAAPPHPAQATPAPGADDPANQPEGAITEPETPSASAEDGMGASAATSDVHLHFIVRPDDLAELLDAQPLPEDVLGEQDEIGVATGMAATSVGGDILLIEAATTPGKGQFTLTGKLGDVMQESARAALTYTRRRAPEFGVDPKFFEKNDIHVHVPAGAIPKDGPSAGVTMATAMVSAVTRRPIRRDVSMTGEISLRGKVLPVGGIKEKVLAAHRNGIRTIVLPKDNARDLRDVPEDLRDDIHFIFAEHVDDVLNTALHAETLPPRDRLRPELKPGAGSRAADEDGAKPDDAKRRRREEREERDGKRRAARGR